MRSCILTTIPKPYRILLICFFSIIIQIGYAQTTSQILNYGSSWKYLDNNTRPGDWNATVCNETLWSTGVGKFGFGGDGENTTIQCGTCSVKYISSYFRTSVNVADPTLFVSFTFNVIRDDGIVIYVNGVEVTSDNMPSARLHSTLASNGVSGNNETSPVTLTVPNTAFSSGNNIVAVELHQSATNSSDIGFDMEILGNYQASTTLTRGPYLQMGNQTGVTIRWRTAAATNSRVTYGTTFGTYANVVDDATATTEHVVRINGLIPDTKYYYTIGSSTQTLQATNTNYVLTLPPSNTSRKLRFLALGDCGNNSTNQVDVKNAAISYVGANNLDALLTMGDNAYSTGTDAEFQTNFFNVYKDDLLKYNKLYPVPGNHDYGSSTTDSRTNPYYTHFSLPTAAECGGVASGTEAYYSYDIGDVHFIALDSYGRENSNTTKLYDTTGAQCVWLKNDLATNTKKWTVVYFHHPPYTKTSHGSDFNVTTPELDLVAIRERFIRILERFGVDLVICGHAHGYERSYLLKSYYNTYASPLDEADFSLASHTATGTNQNAKYDNTTNSCPYTYNTGQYNHGSVYIVSGSAGQIGGSRTGYPHDAMYYSNNTNGGSFYFEVENDRLDAKFISYSGTGGTVAPLVRDQFTIFKNVNKVSNINIGLNAELTLSASWTGTYYWPENTGSTAKSVLVNTSTPGTFNYTVKDASSNNCLLDQFTVTVSSVMPVTLTSFTATLKTGNVFIDWVTSQELNSKSFTIEKSTDGITFELFTRVNASGNSTTSKSYRIIDNSPSIGLNFYRLYQTDEDGRVTYYETRKVNFISSKSFSATAVNTGAGKINIVINSENSENVNMRIVNMNGKEVVQKNFVVGIGTTKQSVQLPSGIYVIILANSRGEKVSLKIPVQ